MKKIYILFVIVALLSACSERRDLPVISGEPSEEQTMDSLMQDTTVVLDVRNPYLIDSVKQRLVYEVCLLSGEGIGKSSAYSSKRGDGYYNTHMVNLIFEDLISGKKQLLTDKRIRIYSYESLLDKTGKEYFLYRVVDRDYNNDKQLNESDTESLYISLGDGTSFTKITKDVENNMEGKWISSIQRYYFQTTEDSDKNGYFDRKDKKHHYYIEFKDGAYTTVEYYPLEMLEKK